MRETNLEWLYNPHAKPAKELSRHDQVMIELGWNACKSLVLPKEKEVSYLEGHQEGERKILERLDQLSEIYGDLIPYPELHSKLKNKGAKARKHRINRKANGMGKKAK